MLSVLHTIEKKIIYCIFTNISILIRIESFFHCPEKSLTYLSYNLNFPPIRNR